MTLWSTLFRKLVEAKKVGAYNDPKGAGIRTTHWFWGAAGKISSAKDTNQTPSGQNNAQAPAGQDAEAEVNSIILQNPEVSGAALVNAMKAKGLKVVKVSEAEVNMVPPESAQNAAKRGLELRKKWGRGGTAVGVARARDLSNGKSLSRNTIAKMSSFARHLAGYDPSKKEPDGGPTAKHIAILLWGGKSGIEWAQKKLTQIDKNKETVEKKHSAKWDTCVAQVSAKGDVESPEAVCTAQLGAGSYESYFHQAAKAIAECQCEKPKEADSSTANVQFLRKEAAFSFNTVKLQEAAADDGIGPTRFKCVLLQEGLGNMRDAYYYSKAALESAIPVFTGSKIYADHPSSIEEESRPERSVRDVLGHFENIQVEETEGRSMLTGEVCILADKPFEWARGLMRHAIEHSKKFPEKNFIGLSINASGDAEELPIEEALKLAPEGAKAKLLEAQAEGISAVKLVSKINSAVSCDLVTEAGAGGMVLSAIK